VKDLTNQIIGHYRNKPENSYQCNTALLTETLYGINSIKSMATENRLIRQWEKRSGSTT
jgi:ABC-type bacteriocin/lantibiotic exporter with double-glycine peptidase domain